MTIEDINKVDFIGCEDNSETIILTISDHLDWGSLEHLEKIQEKLNSYLNFIESGELYDSYPNSISKKIKINMVFKHQPDTDGINFLNKCSQLILTSGYQFNFEVFK